MKIRIVHKYSFHEYLSTTLFLQRKPPALSSLHGQSVLEGIGRCQKAVVPSVGWLLLPPYSNSQGSWAMNTEMVAAGPLYNGIPSKILLQTYVY